MRKRIPLLILALLVCVRWSPFGLARGSLIDKAREAREAAVALTCKGPNGGYFGTGTIIRSDGIILTSSTVIPPGASEIKVFLSAGKILDGHMVAVDTALELALVRLDGGPFPAIPLGTSKTAQVGEPVFTLGNAFQNAQRDGSVSIGVGILSGRYDLAKSIGEATYQGEVLETDAPLNPGSDGGALVDANGALIGLLSLNFSPVRLLGTAVPIDNLAQKIEAHVGKVPRVNAAGETMIASGILDRYSRSTVAIQVKRTEDVKGPVRPRSMPGQGMDNKEIPGLLKRAEGLVTGICIDKAGLILTSWYNMAGKLDGIQVMDNGGVWQSCELLAIDRVDDVALLKAEKGQWQAVALAGPDKIQAGKAVFVLGRSPDPKKLTVTSGILGADRRNNVRLFQHDAALNAGNSGGPVIDRQGAFLGIAGFVGHLWPDWSMNSGIGFAARVDTLVKVLPQLKKKEDLLWPELPFLGVRNAFNLKNRVVIDVVEKFPAHKAGLKKGDEVLRIGKYAVKNWTDLQRAVSAYKVGETVEVEVKRKEEKLVVKVLLGARPQKIN